MPFSRRSLLKSTLTLAGAACANSHVFAEQQHRCLEDKSTVGVMNPQYESLPEALYIAAAKTGPNQFIAALFDGEGHIVAKFPMLARAHGACADKRTKRACIFARRPGMFVCAFDLQHPEKQIIITPDIGRNFYGHGVFSEDGSLLFATENDYNGEKGVIGIYDANAGYRKRGEWASGGIGPHEVVRVPATPYLAVGNSGILTHPDTGREKLNLDTMRPSIALLDSRNGGLVAYHELPDEWHQVSLRHLACTSDGQVWFAGQYEGNGKRVNALAGFISLDESTRSFRRGRSSRGLYPIEIPEPLQHRSQFYLTSVAVSGDNVVYTAAKGGLAFRVNRISRQVEDIVSLIDCSGVAEASEVCVDSAENESQFFLTTGTGTVASLDNSGATELQWHSLQWDNHICRV